MSTLVFFPLNAEVTGEGPQVPRALVEQSFVERVAPLVDIAVPEAVLRLAANDDHAGTRVPFLAGPQWYPAVGAAEVLLAWLGAALVTADAERDPFAQWMDGSSADTGMLCRALPSARGSFGVARVCLVDAAQFLVDEQLGKVNVDGPLISTSVFGDLEADYPVLRPVLDCKWASTKAYEVEEACQLMKTFEVVLQAFCRAAGAAGSHQLACGVREEDLTAFLSDVDRKIYASLSTTHGRLLFSTTVEGVTTDFYETHDGAVFSVTFSSDGLEISIAHGAGAGLIAELLPEKIRHFFGNSTPLDKKQAGRVLAALVSHFGPLAVATGIPGQVRLRIPNEALLWAYRALEHSLIEFARGSARGSTVSAIRIFGEFIGGMVLNDYVVDRAQQIVRRGAQHAGLPPLELVGVGNVAIDGVARAVAAVAKAQEIIDLSPIRRPGTSDQHLQQALDHLNGTATGGAGGWGPRSGWSRWQIELWADIISRMAGWR